ncbi:unnamed protein product, partial [Nesidiocoris tenuis]
MGWFIDKIYLSNIEEASDELHHVRPPPWQAYLDEVLLNCRLWHSTCIAEKIKNPKIIFFSKFDISQSFNSFHLLARIPEKIGFLSCSSTAEIRAFQHIIRHILRNLKKKSSFYLRCYQKTLLASRRTSTYASFFGFCTCPTILKEIKIGRWRMIVYRSSCLLCVPGLSNKNYFWLENCWVIGIFSQNLIYSRLNFASIGGCRKIIGSSVQKLWWIETQNIDLYYRYQSQCTISIQNIQYRYQHRFTVSIPKSIYSIDTNIDLQYQRKHKFAVSIQISIYFWVWKQELPLVVITMYVMIRDRIPQDLMVRKSSSFPYRWRLFRSKSDQ